SFDWSGVSSLNAGGVWTEGCAYLGAKLHPAKNRAASAKLKHRSQNPQLKIRDKFNHVFIRARSLVPTQVRNEPSSVSCASVQTRGADGRDKDRPQTWCRVLASGS